MNIYYIYFYVKRTIYEIRSISSFKIVSKKNSTCNFRQILTRQQVFYLTKLCTCVFQTDAYKRVSRICFILYSSVVILRNVKKPGFSNSCILFLTTEKHFFSADTVVGIGKKDTISEKNKLCLSWSS